MVLMGFFALAAAQNARERALLVGVGLYLVYVVLIGGDFMRGRLLMPAFVSVTLLGVLALSRLYDARRLSRPRLLVGLFGLILLLQFAAPDQNAKLPDSGIVNERLFYVEMSLRRYVEHDFEFSHRFEAETAQLRAFAERCGPFTVHTDLLGAYGYYSLPDIRVIDLLGLTDAYIAGLPNSHLSSDDPRPGHPFRRIPLAYLASRGDVAIFSNWRQAVAAGDCSIIAATNTHRDSQALYDYFSTAGLPTYTGRAASD
jgi:arabinofuranosyltransferase